MDIYLNIDLNIILLKSDESLRPRAPRQSPIANNMTNLHVIFTASPKSDFFLRKERKDNAMADPMMKTNLKYRLFLFLHVNKPPITPEPARHPNCPWCHLSGNRLLFLIKTNHFLSIKSYNTYHG